MHGKKHSEKTKKHWSKTRKGKLVGEKNGMHGKTHTDEVKQKLREQRQGTVGIYNPATGQNKFIPKDELLSWEFLGWQRGRK